MLIYLTNTLIVDKKTPIFRKIKKALRYIAMSVLESKHLLRGDYEILENMEVEFKDDEEIFPLFHQLVSKYSTNTIPNDICRYVEVVLYGYNSYEKDGHKIKQLPFHYFDDSIKVQAMTLVAEDDNDCIMFGYILRHYLREKHLHYNYSFTAQGGGGSRISVTVKRCLKEGKMVACITDSDQRYSGHVPDSHSNCVECKKIKPKDKIYYFFMLPVLELENLIPINHFDSLDWSTDVYRKDRDAYNKLYFNENSEQILPYFDLKEGLKKVHIEQFGEGFIEYAEKCCSCNPDIMEGRSFKEYVDGLNANGLIYPRLRKRPMGELAPLYDNDSLPEPTLMSFQSASWEEVAAFLLDVTCARFKEAIMV